MAGRGKKKKSSAQAESSSRAKRTRVEEEEKLEQQEGEEEEEPQAGPSRPPQVREVETLYKLRMPEDFYHFWEFCKRIRPTNPQDALKETLSLRLVGPFDIMSQRHELCDFSDPNFRLHYRYFYDPPELQTVLQGSDQTHHHMGYYRDSPDALPVFVGENEAKTDGTITQMGDNLFAAVLLFLNRVKRQRGGRGDSEALRQLETALKKEAGRLRLPLEQKTKAMKHRDKKVVSKTFHGAGIVVPVDKNNVGYRELSVSDAELKDICKAIAEAENDEARVKAFAPIQELITYVQFANDECDYGMGYELGVDLFCYGSRYFHKTIGQLLPMAYSLLKRDLFAEIVQDHLANRSNDNLDQLASE